MTARHSPSWFDGQAKIELQHHIVMTDLSVNLSGVSQRAPITRSDRRSATSGSSSVVTAVRGNPPRNVRESTGIGRRAADGLQVDREDQGACPGRTCPAVVGRVVGQCHEGVARAGSRRDPEFGRDLIEVRVDGALGQEEPLADLLVGQARTHLLGDLALPGCPPERADPGGRLVACRPREPGPPGTLRRGRQLEASPRCGTCVVEPFAVGETHGGEVNGPAGLSVRPLRIRAMSSVSSIGPTL